VKKKRKRKSVSINKLQLAWKMLVVISLLINYLQLHRVVVEKLAEQPAVKRWSVLVMCDGLKYRVRKYWSLDI